MPDETPQCPICKSSEFVGKCANTTGDVALTAGSTVGAGVVCAKAGAAAGAVVGSIIPVVGTAIGAVLFGALGGVAGAAIVGGTISNALARYKCGKCNHVFNA